MNILVSHQAAPHILQQNFACDYKNEDFFNHSRIIISVMLRGENVEVRIECVKLQLKIVFLLTQAIDSHKNGRRFHKFRNDRNTC